MLSVMTSLIWLVGFQVSFYIFNNNNNNNYCYCLWGSLIDRCLQVYFFFFSLLSGRVSKSLVSAKYIA